MHRDEKVKRVVYHPNTIFNLTKGPIVCYLSCRGVNCRDLMLANLYIGSPPRSIGGVSGISGGGSVSSGGGGGGGCVSSGGGGGGGVSSGGGGGGYP